jgi:response regulator RpfG family c-di-GMP phosphodiesterase
MSNADDRTAVVLVVEDVDWIRSGMTNSVRNHGYRVIEAKNDEEAVLAAEVIHPGMILAEEELPTFVALMEKVRVHPTLKGLPVVIINPDADENTRYGPAVVLNDYSQLKTILPTFKRHEDNE